MKKIISFLILLFVATTLSAQNDNGFDPETPSAPYENYFDPISKVLYLGVNEDGELSNTISDILENYSYTDVQKLIVACPMTEYDLLIIGMMTKAEVFDFRNASGISRINDYLFNGWGTYELRTIYLPASVTKIETNFSKATKLTRMVCYATTPPTATSTLLQNNGNASVYVPDESLNAYKAADVWKNLNLLPISSLQETSVQLSSVTLNLQTPDGQDVTDRVTINWIGLNDENLGTGSVLHGVTKNQKVLYRITLPADMKDIYKAPQSSSIVGTEQDQSVNILLEPWPQNAFDGSKITVNITYSGIGDNSDVPSLDDLVFSVEDLTANETIESRFDGQALRLTKAVPEGHNLRISLSSASRLFADVKETITLNRLYNTLTLNLVENGHTIINYDVPTMELMCLVFDKDNKRVSTAIGTGGQFVITNIPDGEYMATVIAYDNRLANVATLENLERLVVYSDIKTPIKVEVGKTGNYNVVMIPLKTYQSHLSPIFTVDKHEMTVGEFFVVSNFSSTGMWNATNATITLEVPEGIRLFEGSVCDVFKQPVSYYMEGNNIVIPNTTGVYVSLVSNRPGTYTINSYISYYEEGVEFNEPFGSATITYDKIKIYAPSAINGSTAVVSGYAPQGARVNVYDNAALVGSVYAQYDGQWKASVPVSVKSTPSYHAITAEYVGDDEIPVETEGSILFAGENACVLKSVKMYAEPNIEVRINSITGTAHPSYYSYVPGTTNCFTFVAELDNLERERVRMPRFHVYTTGNTVCTLKAEYNEELGAYTAMSYFPEATSIPYSVEFSYTYYQEVDADALAERLFAEEVAAYMDFSDLMEKHIKNDVHNVNVLADTDEELLFTFDIDGSEEPMRCHIKAIMRDELATIIDAHSDDIVRRTTVENGTTINFYSYEDEECLCQMVEDEVSGNCLMTRLMVEGQQSQMQSHKKIAPAIAIGYIYAGYNVLAGGKAAFDHVTNVWNIRTIIDNFVMEMNHQYEQDDKYLREMFKAISDMIWRSECENGSVDFNQRKQWQQKEEKIAELDHDYLNDFRERIDAYAGSIAKYAASEVGDIIYDLGMNVVGGNVGKTARFAAFKKGGKFFKYRRNISDAAGTMVDIADRTRQLLNPDTDEPEYIAEYKRIVDWSNSEYGWVTAHYEHLYKDIVAAFMKCDKKDDKIVEQPTTQTGGGKQTGKMDPIIDPSGYVYEGVPSNRLSGVTATIYYRESASVSEDRAEEWIAENYGQVNPLVTADDGFYRWDVPKGLWQVRFHKDGYADTQTEWLPVPPPQLEVNVPMVAAAKPAVKEAKAYTDGVVVEFSKYMDIPSVKQNVRITTSGTAVTGSVAALNEETGVNGISLANCFRFTPTKPIDSKTVTLNVAAATKDYASQSFGSDYSKVLTVVSSIESLTVPETVNAYVGQPTTIKVKATPAEAVSGKMLSVEPLLSFITVDPAYVTFDEQGEAEVTISSSLPASTDIVMSVGEMKATTKVGFTYEKYDAVAVPMADVLDGSLVPAGTEVKLSCMTDGATIYYTLDGTCPCYDTPSRHIYTEPIVINETVTIKAMASCKDMMDSEVASYTYRVAVDGIGRIDLDADEVVYTIDGKRVQRPLSPGLYIGVSKSPSGITHRKFIEK